MNFNMPRPTIFRIRPFQFMGHGLPETDLNNLAGRFANVDVSDVQRRKHFFDPLARHGVDVIGAKLETILLQSTDIVLDLAYKQSLRKTFNQVLAQALNNAAPNLTDNHRVLVLMDTFWSASDLAMIALTEGLWGGVTNIVDNTGRTVAENAKWQVSEEVIAMCRIEPRVYLDEFRRRLIRGRGVFGHAEGQIHRYNQYRYFGDYATNAVSSLLSEFYALPENDCDAILIPGDTSEWFQTAVTAFAAESRKVVLTTPQIEGDTSLSTLNSALDDLRNHSGLRISIAVPVFRFGRSLSQLAALARSTFDDVSLLPLSIIAQRSADGAGGAANDVQKFPEKRIVRLNGSEESLHFFLPVDPDGLDEGHWLVSLAQSLDEVLEVPPEWTNPTTAGMWALFDTLEFAPEEPYTDTSRPRIANFPRMWRLEVEDAKWLAYSMLQAVDPELNNPKKSSETLVVVPDERSGSLPLASAFLECLDVPVARIPRDAMERSEDLKPGVRELLNAYADKRIAICDESVVSGSTFRKLDKLLTEFRGRGADVKVAAIHADIGGTGEVPESLYRWNPILALPAGRAE